jgi:hypothetical protein
MFNFNRKEEKARATQWRKSWDVGGLNISRGNTGSPLDHELAPAYLAQLKDDGYATASGTEVEIGWDALYEALQSPGYSDLPKVLDLPDWTTTRPILCSSNSLTDKEFSIYIAGWQAENGATLDFTTVGPVLSNNGLSLPMMPLTLSIAGRESHIEHWQMLWRVAVCGIGYDAEAEVQRLTSRAVISEPPTAKRCL